LLRTKSFIIYSYSHLAQCKALEHAALRDIPQLTVIFSTLLFTARLKTRPAIGSEVAFLPSRTEMWFIFVGAFSAE
jgi:hypothetical protein